jgi:hypothetical protein
MQQLKTQNWGWSNSGRTQTARKSSRYIATRNGMIRERSDEPRKYQRKADPRSNGWKHIKSEFEELESKYLHLHHGDVWIEVLNSTAQTQNSTAAQFSEAVERWYSETAFISDTNLMSMHPDYQRIIGMGKASLPYIFQELRANRGNWFWALVAITGHDAAQEDQSYKEAVAAWMEWGKGNGYVTT